MKAHPVQADVILPADHVDRFADLIVFAANPLDLAPDAQPADAVLGTVVGGAVRFHLNHAEGNS
ncbi:hypothetical protein J7E93_17060 [Streptomyces sp. ISL-36]|uniref:hypothetical protein n=1 Tax=Streptomyces sp. ISL-36 TaxID=2819182 RepID=UPI001BE7F9AF|nr:hypothetical protein [Streptomyces sp. ISL-36]MBT2441792.1 hypothetical protein [Streptomyces sp. ISL-36]